MLTETGRVVAVDADGLWVETIRQSTCGVCAAQKACGHGLINRMTDGKRSYIRVLPGEQAPLECSVDDQVRISIPEEVILRGSFIAYLLPLICMLAGALVGVEFFAGSEDGKAALGGIAGLLIGFAAVRWHAVSHRRDPKYQPVLVAVLPPPADAVRIV